MSREKIRVITNGARNGLSIENARVYIGGGYGKVQKLNALTDENGEIEIETEDLIEPYVFRIRFYSDNLMLKPFECKAKDVLKVFTDKNPFSLIKNTIYLYRDDF